MLQILASIALRLPVCLVVSYLVWRQIGLVGLAATAPLYGVLLAKPLLELISELRGSVRSLAFADIQGRHFEHRGFALDIVEDERHHRWISVKDVQKLIPALPRAAVLQAQFPDGVQHDPAISGARIHDQALLRYLAKATEGDSLRFRNWLEREVIQPGAKRRQRLGIRDPQPVPEEPQEDRDAAPGAPREP